MTGDGGGASAGGTASGRTTFTARALERLAVGIARDHARVATRDVGVRLSDRRGALRIAITVPVVTTASTHGEGLVRSGAGLRRALIDGMRERAGREVGAVDIRYSGVQRNTEKRVR